MTFLQKIYKRSPIIGILMAMVFIGYTALHFIGLELYPFQLFPMYSLKEYSQLEYTVYKIYDSDMEYDLASLPYREYTYVMNTVRLYDQVQSSGSVNETEVVDKFLVATQMKDSRVADFLHSPYQVSDPMSKMRLWLKKKLKIEHPQIKKYSYNYDQNDIQFITEILP